MSKAASYRGLSQLQRTGKQDLNLEPKGWMLNCCRPYSSLSASFALACNVMQRDLTEKAETQLIIPDRALRRENDERD